MWLIENPWPPVVLCVVFALVGVFLWSLNKRGRHLLLTCVFLVLGGICLLVDAAVVTEAERVADQVRDLCFAFQRGEVERSCGYFSGDTPDLKNIVRQGAGMVRVGNDLVVSDIEVRSEGTPEHLVSRFRAKGTVFLKIGGSEENCGYQPSQWELVWKQEPEGWRIVKLTRLNPFNQQQMQVFQQSAR